MGLDMYLRKRTYLDGSNVEVVVKTKGYLTDAKIGDTFKFNKAGSISQLVGYWRKANHIHNWFVENVQEGVDNCSEYYVSRDSMRELLDVCNEVLNKCRIENDNFVNQDVAEDLLPRCMGCFFGSDRYDEDYLIDIEQTVMILNDALKNDDSKLHSDFYYSSSW